MVYDVQSDYVEQLRSMARALPASWFQRSTLVAARELLGCTLVRRRGSRTLRGTIVEVEAYDGPHDRASHAHRGRTPRNAVMFGPAGVWYVYMVYGMHWMLNIVTGPVGYPAAVLIRGVVMDNGTLVSGPARVTKRFGITRFHTGITAHRSSGLWIEESRQPLPRSAIHRTPRIGVDYAGVWAQKPYRWVASVDEDL